MIHLLSFFLKDPCPGAVPGAGLNMLECQVVEATAVVGVSALHYCQVLDALAQAVEIDQFF